MVEGVHGKPFAEEIVHNASLFRLHKVCCHVAFGLLRVFQQGGVGQGGGEVLVNRSAEGCREQLYAATDAEDRHSAVVGQARKGYFHGVAHVVDAVECRHGVFAQQHGVNVRTAR